MSLSALLIGIGSNKNGVYFAGTGPPPPSRHFSTMSIFGFTKCNCSHGLTALFSFKKDG
jgi:hypothetical protein